MVAGRRKEWVLVILAVAALMVLDRWALRALWLCEPPAPVFSEIGFYLGHGLVQTACLAVVFLAGRLWNRARLQWAAGLGFAAYVFSGGLAQMFKHMVARPRPKMHVLGHSWPGQPFGDAMDSFPSGHTTTSVAIALVLSWFYPKGAPVFMAAAGLVGAARIMCWTHYPLDVAGGVLLGLLVGWAVVFFARPYLKRRGMD